MSAKKTALVREKATTEKPAATPVVVQATPPAEVADAPAIKSEQPPPASDDAPPAEEAAAPVKKSKQTLEEFTLALLEKQLPPETASGRLADVMSAVASNVPVTISASGDAITLNIHYSYTYRSGTSTKELAEHLGLDLKADINSKVLAKFPAE